MQKKKNKTGSELFYQKAVKRIRLMLLGKRSEELGRRKSLRPCCSEQRHVTFSAIDDFLIAWEYSLLQLGSLVSKNDKYLALPNVFLTSRKHWTTKSSREKAKANVSLR